VANDFEKNMKRGDTTRMSETDKSVYDEPKIDQSIEDQDKQEKEKKKRKKRILIILGIVVLVAIIGLLIYFFWIKTDESDIGDDNVPRGQGLILNPDNIDEARRLMDGPASPDAQYTVSLTTHWVFETWNTPSHTASVDNLASNSRTVYFDVVLDETDELVYTSPFIPLGEVLEDFALDTYVPAGEHIATVTFVLVDDDHEFVADVSVSVTLTILG